MNISKEINSARRKNIWKQLIERYPATHEYGLLQELLAEMNLTYEKDSTTFYIKRIHLTDTSITSLVLSIKTLEVIVSCSENATNLPNFNGQDFVPDIGYTRHSNTVYRPFSVLDIARILRKFTFAPGEQS